MPFTHRYLIVRLCTFGTIPKVCNVLNFCGFDDPSGYQSDMHLCWLSFAFCMLFVKDTESLFLGRRRIFGFGKLCFSSPQVPKTRFSSLGNFVPQVPKFTKPGFTLELRAILSKLSALAFCSAQLMV